MARARSSKTFELRCCQTSVENNDVTFSVAENKRFQRHYISRFEQDYKVAPLTDIFAFYDFTDEFDKDKVFENFIIHAAPHWGKYNIKYSVAFLEEVPPNIETTGTPNIPTPLCSQFAEYFIEKKITFADVESGQDLALASGRLPVIAIRLSFTKTDNNVRKPFNQKLLSASYALVPNSLRQIPTRPEWTITNGSDELIVPDQIFRASATLTMLCRRQTRCIEQGAVYLENVDFEALRFLKSAFLGELAAEDLLSFQLDQISQVLVTIDYLLMVPAFLVQNSNIFDKLVASIDEYDCQKLLNSLPMSVHLSQLKQKLREKVRAAIQNALENDDFIDRVQLIQ
ncbi:hypothetical protein MIR68_005495 [Amoeboaphelidium protococcarum]|nr:hypothetical protein MIR68_005495 [Amoeboaphelidium protococcarum]